MHTFQELPLRVNLAISMTLQGSPFPVHLHMSVWTGINGHSFNHFRIGTSVYFDIEIFINNNNNFDKFIDKNT